MYLIFDTETTGLPRNWNAPITDTDNWPRCIQIAWQLHDELGNLIENQDYLVRPDGFNIPYDAERIHGISTELAAEQGIGLDEVLEKFNVALSKAKFVVGQNVGFDVNIMGCEFHRLGVDSPMAQMPVLDTCTETTAELLKLPGGRGGKFKLPTLTELHQYLFGEPFSEAHNATADVEATTRCFLQLIKLEVFRLDQLQADQAYINRFKQSTPQVFERVGLNHINLKSASEEIRKRLQQAEGPKVSKTELAENKKELEAATYVHLHNHTQFSVLQSTINIPSLIKAAAGYKMPAVAMTDHANMMGAFHFVAQVLNHNKGVEARNEAAVAEGKTPEEQIIKPIIGCEFFVCDNHLDKSRKDNGYQVVLLAKNKTGYHNLAKMSSIAYTKGFYYIPRIDKAVIEQYKEDILVLSGNLYGEISSKLLNLGEKQAEEALLWWKEQFGDDFYIELMRHSQEDEDIVNGMLVGLAKKHEVKLIATNNTYYINKKDANAHDILLCVKDGEKQATPIGRGRGFRFGLPNQEYYFKSPDEMKKLFTDLPEAIVNIQEIVDKIEIYKLAREVLLPKFDISDEFLVKEDETDGGKRGENKYLRHLTYVGAKKRYGEITPEIEERLDFELQTIEKTGYPGYFLIVQDFIAEARNLDVSVGPGRGSAAGSAVAYCLGITNIDPIKYDLLFERFLNPDRVSMPDIDIDFDDEGRGRVMDYVIKKYGANQVAQIITYGTMAAKSSIKDTARVLDLPLFEAEKIAKLIPNMKLAKIFTLDEKSLKEALRPDEYEKVLELKNLAEAKDLGAKTLEQAQILEGSLRNTGIHACGVIITPSDITNFVPVATAKDSDLYVTQFDNSVVESAGLLKMDFLGLKTLTLIKDTVKLVKFRHDIDLDPDSFPIDDVKTYELFQRGETIGIFQYESTGMQKYMKELKPTVFGDLIAMNALYRPGPLEYIPSFVRRKNGEEEIKYDLDACEEYLKETYGITVYQEQVMLLSQKLAGFTKGEADVLRKAMGKKQKEVLDKMKPKFVKQAAEKGHDPATLEKIWKDWEAFASYAFNKSHSTCYAWIAYQTAYLKAHFPAEYMAAVLSNNMSDIKQVAFFMEECKQMGVRVLGPDVNESGTKFSVNIAGEVRFGLSGIKGVGDKAVESIIEDRKENGMYKDLYDFARRSNTRTVNKKAYESFVYSGAFDGFGNHRAQYFFVGINDKLNGIEKVIKYANDFQNNESSSQSSLFGGSIADLILEPSLPVAPEWSLIDRLKFEKDAIGIFLSGHPLDNYKLELKEFCQHKVRHLALVNKIRTGDTNEEVLAEFETIKNRELVVGGLVVLSAQRMTKTGKPFGTMVFEDYDDTSEMALFGDDFIKFKQFLTDGYFLQIRGRVGERFRKEGDWEFKITSINLLSELRDKLAKSVTIQVPIERVNDDFMSQILAVLENNKASTDQQNCQLLFDIYDREQNVVVKMPSKSFKINPTNDFLDQLEALNVGSKLN
ncbi:DNA polymerase III subunit alpha [Pedobacter hiemivivus]|uniref:DNA polymerase III subunit alpha n=1 Tax=Pedobacter hiemivivus TaxID=2530454 RepID=A0A4R0NAB6_9SPHI|nr:DNA polymerase III subunit alpha [Pedobacter hiemivivus]TCC95832.1 DNA polymerase III subunit alpha [Pedobacter hiemivivus]TKC61352.1 DNA polymerase III subunit alpha [Pedobacter hiemivivus]